VNMARDRNFANARLMNRTSGPGCHGNCKCS
jgi:hypothetical protein